MAATRRHGTWVLIAVAASVLGVAGQPLPDAEATPETWGKWGSCGYAIRNYQYGTGYSSSSSANAYSKEGTSYCQGYKVRVGNSATGNAPWGPAVSSGTAYALSRGVTTAPFGAKWYSDHYFGRDDGTAICMRLYFGSGVSYGKCANHGNARLYPGGRLLPGQRMVAGTGHTLLMQSDGNLVLIAPGNVPIWSSQTAGHAGAFAEMQTDGNLVVYSSTRVPLGHTGTNGNPGAYLAVQTDSNLVVYTSGGTALWDRMTKRLNR